MEVDHYSVQVRRELFTQLDIDDKYLDDAEPRPLGRRIRSRLRCSRTKLYETLVYIFPIIEILKTYEWKTFTLGTILIRYSIFPFNLFINICNIESQPQNAELDRL